MVIKLEVGEVLEDEEVLEDAELDVGEVLEDEVLEVLEVLGVDESVDELGVVDEDVVVVLLEVLEVEEDVALELVLELALESMIEPPAFAGGTYATLALVPGIRAS